MYSNNMKKQYTLLSIFLFTLMAFTAKAQDKDVTYVKSYLGFFGGISNPVGDFGKSDYNNNQAGFAHRGVSFSLDAAVYVYKNLAIGANVSLWDHPGLSYNNTLALANGYTASYNADETDITSTNNYRSLNLLIGPQYSFTYKKFVLDVRANAGFIKNSSSPQIATTMYGVLNQTATFYQDSQKKTLIGYGGLIGLRYKFSDSWGINLRGSYVDTKGLDVTTTGRLLYEGRNQTHIPISVFQTTMGITLDL